MKLSELKKAVDAAVKERGGEIPALLTIEEESMEYKIVGCEVCYSGTDDDADNYFYINGSSH